MGKYLTAPVPTTRMPAGIPYIVGNEAAERFSFYGMTGILTIFMTNRLLNASGAPDMMSEEESKTVYHLFTAAAYFFPLLGSLLADIVWGKFRTIMILSMGYCLGHGCLALMDVGPATGLFDMRPLLYAGLLFIAIGAGGIKPCVSANVGDQFGPQNQHLVSKVFSWFYFSINLGAALSNLITPVLLAKVGPWAAFGLPGVLMGVATLVMWLGRKKFVHIPPAGWRRFVDETFSPDGLRALLNLAPIFLLFIPVFWSLFHQTGSAWVLQAEKMNRRFMGIDWYESQIQAANPILILVLIPLFAYVVYPAVGKVFRMTPLRRIAIGLFATAGAFALSSLIEERIVALAPAAAERLWAALGTTGAASYEGLSQALRQANEARLDPQLIASAMVDMPSIAWQLLAYVLITAAEVMVSITALEFAYTQAPRKMKSFIMGVYFLGVSLGNLFTSAVNHFIQNDDGSVKLAGADYFWFFTAVMAVAAVIFAIYSIIYKGRTYVQGEST